MPRTPDLLTRRLVLSVLTGAAVFLPLAAIAGEHEDEDEDEDESDEDGGEDSGEDDNSGSGGGEDNDGPEDDDDNSGPGGGEDDGGEDDGGENDGGGNDGGATDASSRNSSDRLRNVTVRYSDGWTELILDGQYKLIDNLNRQVILRQATIEDFNRMVALGS